MLVFPFSCQNYNRDRKPLFGSEYQAEEENQ